MIASGRRWCHLIDISRLFSSHGLEGGIRQINGMVRPTLSDSELDNSHEYRSSDNQSLDTRCDLNSHTTKVYTRVKPPIEFIKNKHEETNTANIMNLKTVSLCADQTRTQVS